MALSTGKVVEILFDKALDTYEHQMQMLPLVTFTEPDAAMSQNAGNVIWRPTQQHAPVIDGFDLTGLSTGIIEETYPAILGTPKNDFVQVRADDMRDKRFWERRGVQSGLMQATELNKTLANAIITQGSLFYRSNATSGYNFISQAQALMNERQLIKGDSQRYFVINDRDNLTFGADLAGRQTLQGRPEQTWQTGQIGQNVAEFDVYVGSFLNNITGGAGAAIVDGNQSFKPEGGSVNTATGVVTNVDYRVAEIPCTSASLTIQIGDKIKFTNSGTDVMAVGLADKTNTNQPMTFTVVDVDTDENILTIYPKPIALNDPALTTLEKAYANINTRILTGATITRLNTDASAKTNIFWDKSAVEIYGGTIPAQLFQEFRSAKVVTETMKNGLTMYLMYDGDITTMNFRYRLFTWYGVTIANPSACGVAVRY